MSSSPKKIILSIKIKIVSNKKTKAFRFHEVFHSFNNIKVMSNTPCVNRNLSFLQRYTFSDERANFSESVVSIVLLFHFQLFIPTSNISRKID